MEMGNGKGIFKKCVCACGGGDKMGEKRYLFEIFNST